MTQAAKTTITLSVLAVVVLVGAAVGWRELTAPVPDPTAQEAQGPCENVRVRKGDPVRPDMVVVSVYNAGTKSGLAGRTLSEFTRRGFGTGESGNADRQVKVTRAQVWTRKKKHPAAQLVYRWLGPKRTKLVVKPARKLEGVGVMVVVGNKFDKLVKGPKQVRSRIKATVCTPVTPDQPS